MELTSSQSCLANHALNIWPQNMSLSDHHYANISMHNAQILKGYKNDFLNEKM